MSLRLVLIAASLAFAVSLPAQLLPGDIGATMFSPSTFSVVDSATGLVTPYNVGWFGGLGTSRAQ